MERLALWPLDAICFAWDTRKVGGFWAALVFCVRQMWRRAGWYLVLEPIYVATAVGIILLAVVVVIGIVALFVAGVLGGLHGSF